MLTADVAMEDHDEIAQDSSCMLAHNQGMIVRVMDLRSSITAPAVSLSRVPRKTTKITLRIIWYHMLHACLLLHELEKNKTNYHDSYSYELVQQQSYYLDIAREKSSPILVSHILKL